MKTKLVIVMRTDLKDTGGNKVRTGKLLAQAGHASHWWMKSRIVDLGDHLAFTVDLSEEEIDWMRGEASAKIALQVPSEDALMEVYQKAIDAGLTAHVITDFGHTQFGGVPTKTCVAIGPHEAEKIDPVTKELKTL